MYYQELAELYEKLEATTKKLEKRDMIANFLKETAAKKPKILPKVTYLAMGKTFPKHSEKEIGIAGKLMQSILLKATGIKKKELSSLYRKLGDLGLAAENLIERKKQRTLYRHKLSIEEVFRSIKKLPSIKGERSQARKASIVSGLLSAAKPLEARYLVRTVLERLRIGVGEGIIRDSIARAFDVSPEKVEEAFNLLTDYGEIAQIANETGEKGLESAKIKLGRPVRVMLAQKAPSFKEALAEYAEAQLEFKLDGFRAQIHKAGEKIKIFSRRLEDVTNQFPDIEKLARKHLKPERIIVEGEIIAIDPESHNPLPFQQLSERIHRKYSIEQMIKEVPVEIYLFDCIYSQGKDLMKEPLTKRWNELQKQVEEADKFKLVQRLRTGSLKKAKNFYTRSLETQEGLLVKNLQARYRPGKRVGYWLKVKPVMEPLDLVITGAEWGRGERAGWLSSFLLAARDPETGQFKSTGMMGTGLTEKQFELLTKKLKPLIEKQSGRKVMIKPKLVVEVAYEEIQKSPKYETSLALRFPRLVRLREMEKSPVDADTVERIRELFKKQKAS